MLDHFMVTNRRYYYLGNINSMKANNSVTVKDVIFPSPGSNTKSTSMLVLLLNIVQYFE